MKRIFITLAAISFLIAMTSCSTSNTLSANRCVTSKKCNRAAKKVFNKSPKVWCSQGAFNEW